MWDLIEWRSVTSQKIIICELMGFGKIIREIKTKYVSLLKIRMLVQIVSELLPQLCSNDSIQILVKMAWFLTLGTKPIFIRICMRSSEQNRDNISSMIGSKMLNFGMEAFFISIFLNITTKLVISQIYFLWRHHVGTLLALLLYLHRKSRDFKFSLE